MRFYFSCPIYSCWQYRPGREMDKSENAHGLTVIHSAFNCPPFCSKIFCALLFFSRKRVRSYKAEVMRGACSPLAPRQTDDIRRVVSFCCLFIVMAAKKEEGDVQTYVCRQTSIRTVVLLTFMLTSQNATGFAPGKREK